MQPAGYALDGQYPNLPQYTSLIPLVLHRWVELKLANSSGGGYYIPYKHEHDKIQPELTIATQVELTNKIT